MEVPRRRLSPLMYKTLGALISYYTLYCFALFVFFFPWRFEHQFQFLWPPIKNTYRRGRERERGQATGIWGPGRELDA